MIVLMQLLIFLQPYSLNPVISDAESDKHQYMILEFCQGESLMGYMNNNLYNTFGVEVHDFHSALLG